MMKFFSQLKDSLIQVFLAMEHMVLCIMATFETRFGLCSSLHFQITFLIHHVDISKWMQEVAIKRMTATKTKEFMAEMKILCKVHHSNLVMLLAVWLITNYYKLWSMLLSPVQILDSYLGFKPCQGRIDWLCCYRGWALPYIWVCPKGFA